MKLQLTYKTLEKLSVLSPVDRIDYISDYCIGKNVLDVGCFDETALFKRDTQYWLHGRIAQVAKIVVGIDNSAMIPSEGLLSASNAKIFRGNGVNPDEKLFANKNINLIIAAEFIEHVENPLEFFDKIKKLFPSQELIISTPNGVSFANTLLGMIGREAQHPDHIHIFTYKILNTLCLRSKFTDWEIIPYRFFATEMIMKSSGIKRSIVIIAEWIIRKVERIFPLLSFGYIVRIKL